MPWADVSLFAHRDDGECGTGAGFSDLLRDHLSPRYKLVFAGTGDRVHSCDAAGRDAQEIAGQFFLREEMAHFPTKGDTRFIAGKLLEMLSRETD
jgi:hypothetical protein